MKYIIISKTLQGYRIRVDIPGTSSQEQIHFIGYTKRNAIKVIRQAFGLKGKHLIVKEV